MRISPINRRKNFQFHQSVMGKKKSQISSFDHGIKLQILLIICGNKNSKFHPLVTERKVNFIKLLQKKKICNWSRNLQFIFSIGNLKKKSLMI